MPQSKYVKFGTHTFAEFANSRKGTVAKYYLTPGTNARKEVSKSLKAACTKENVNCQIKTTDLLVKGDDGKWTESHILEAVIC